MVPDCNGVGADDETPGIGDEGPRATAARPTGRHHIVAPEGV